MLTIHRALAHQRGFRGGKARLEREGTGCSDSRKSLARIGAEAKATGRKRGEPEPDRKIAGKGTHKTGKGRKAGAGIGQGFSIGGQVGRSFPWWGNRPLASAIGTVSSGSGTAKGKTRAHPRPQGRWNGTTSLAGLRTGKVTIAPTEGLRS